MEPPRRAKTNKGWPGRLVPLSTKAALPYTEFAFRPGDILLVGREPAGVPDAVHAAADHRVLIPIRPPPRSLNVAVAAAMAVGEAPRQLAEAETDTAPRGSARP